MHSNQKSTYRSGPKLLDFAAEGAALGQTGTASSRLAKNRRAASTDDNRLCVGKDCGNIEASRALHVHEVAVGGLDKALELVLTLLGRGIGMKEILFKLHN